MPGAPGTDGEHEPSSGLTYRPALDGVRALAVAAVVAYHLEDRKSTRLNSSH